MSDEKIAQMYNALKRIMAYGTTEWLRRRSEKECGLPYEEALEYAYENICNEAANGLRGVRLPKSKTGHKIGANTAATPAKQEEAAPNV